MPLGSSPFQLRSDDHVEAGLRAVLLADPADLVGALVVHRVDVEAVAEVRHLNDRRLLVERGESCPVGDVLVGTDDEGLIRLDVVGQHLVVADRRNRHDAAQVVRARVLSANAARRLCAFTIAISPHVGHPADELDIRVGHRVAGNRARNFRGSRRKRDLGRRRRNRGRSREAA